MSAEDKLAGHSAHAISVGPALSLQGTAPLRVCQRWDTGVLRRGRVVPCRSAPATPPRLQLSERRQEEDLNSAIFQLIRNVGLLCNDPLLTCLGKPVKEWSTKTTLATLAGGHLSSWHTLVAIATKCCAP